MTVAATMSPAAELLSRPAETSSAAVCSSEKYVATSQSRGWSVRKTPASWPRLINRRTRATDLSHSAVGARLRDLAAWVLLNAAFLRATDDIFGWRPPTNAVCI